MLKFFLVIFLLKYSSGEEILKQKTMKLDDNNYFLVNTLEFEIEKKDNIYLLNGFSLPSDLLEAMSPGQQFQILINQGRLPSAYKEKFYFSRFEKEKNNLLDFLDDNSLIDYPSGLLFHSDNFSPFGENFSKFKNLIDLFSNVFKITKNPFLDRSSYITVDKDVFLTENSERACTDHLDAIKEVLPSKKWNEFAIKVDYHNFAQSDYKSIKYSIKNVHNAVKFLIKVIYKLDSKTTTDSNKNNFYEFISDNKITHFSNKRSITGEVFGFENFKYSNEIIISAKEIKSLQIVDLIPDQLDILLYSMKVDLYYNNTIFSLKEDNLKFALDIDIIEGVEEQNPVVPFTYENKKTLKVYFKVKKDFIENYLKDVNIKEFRINFSYELRKRLLNFESYENEAEFGYKYPCGLILLNDIPFITNHVYFNMPNVDNTMPFHIISCTWVIFGFLFIQTLNLFLGSKGKLAKSLFQKIKDRFMAKWGFLFGR